MARQIDCNFAHSIAEAVLEDDPHNEEAVRMFNLPAYRVNDRYFGTRDEMSRYLNSAEAQRGLEC